MPKRRLRSGSNLPMNSSCFLCNIEIPGDSKDLFEHFRSIHFITTEPAKDSPIYIDEQPDDNKNEHCPDLEELSFHDIAMECGEVPLDADVSKWTAEDVARKLRMETFDQTVIDTFKDEDIDGTSLLTLTREDLNELKLKLGHKKKMERLIQTLQEKPLRCRVPLDADVSKWTAEDVARKLRMETFDQTVIDTFKDEDIDGTSLLTLTREDLNELKLKLGHKKKMERLIQTLQEKPLPIKKTEEPTISIPISQPSMSLSAMGSYPTIVQPSVFSPNVPVSSPNFPVSSASFSASSPANYTISSENVSVLSSENVSALSPDAVLSPASNISSVLPSTSVSILPSTTVSMLPSANVSILPSTNVMVSSQISCVPLSSSNISMSSPNVIPVSSTVTPVIHLQPIVTQKVHMQQLPNIDSSSSPSHRSDKSIFDVKQMVMSSSKGRAVYEEYLARDKTFLTVPERRTIVFVVVEAMVNEYGLYPTTQEKDMLAAAIIQAFPCLGIRDGNNLIHSHYYHAKSGGFIETLLKTMRKKQPECRKRKQSLKQKIHRRIPRGYIEDCGPELEEEEIQMHEFMVRLLKSLIPTASNADQINDAMESTYPFRQYQMKKNLTTPSLILAEYPRMVDFNNGLLIFGDFKRKYPMANDIEQNFTQTYGERLIFLAEKELDALPVCNNDFLRLLLVCIFIMPEIRKIRKNTLEEKVHQLVIFVSENRNLQELVAIRSKQDQTNSSPYPYLVGVGTMTDPIYFNLVIDGNIIPCGSDSLTAFKNLFASYFVFQLHYPVLIKPLFKFFEERVFRLTSTMTATTADFVARLESIPR